MAINAGYIIIGDEILSGRTQDENLNFLAKNLTEMGIFLREVRVVPDEEGEIIAAVNGLRKKFDYVFTSGGIGPTHDDITSLAISKAFGVELVRDEDAKRRLKSYHDDIGDENDPRLKMADIPRGSALLDNDVSSAPGFMIENVIVMAGIPKIMRHMFEAAKKNLQRGSQIIAREIVLKLQESAVAKDFEAIQNEFGDDLSLGSYPHSRKVAKGYEWQVSLVFKSQNKAKVTLAYEKMKNAIISSFGDEVILQEK